MSTILDFPIATAALDSSGEILQIENVDISDFIEGKAVANWEHNNDNPEDIIGRFLTAKKILSEQDCENDRQKMYWDKVKKPFIYGVLELMDSEGHPGAVAVAAMVRYFAKRNEPIQVGASIEGQTLERDGNILKRAVARKCAITLKPCNKECWVNLLEERPELEIFKTESDRFNTVNVDSIMVSFDAKQVLFEQIQKNVQDLLKTLTAGMGNVAPSQLVQGAALAVEQVEGSKKNRIKAALRDWDRKTPLRDVIKSALPEVSEEYLDHFADLAEDLVLKNTSNRIYKYELSTGVSLKICGDGITGFMNGLPLSKADVDSLFESLRLKKITAKKLT